MTKRTLDFADARPFEIFRTGRHTPMSGSPISFAETDLDQIAGSYDPAVMMAPIVVGHPKLDAPAYGWVSGLSVDGDRLVATPDQVDPAFAEMVRAGRYKTVSAAFYRPGQSGNPRADGYYLRHVGFLGAVAPAVKGLRPAEFGDDGDFLTIEFGDDWAAASAVRTASRLFRSLRDWLIGTAGQEVADRVLPDWDVQSLSDLPATIDLPTPAYADPSVNPSNNEDPNMPTKDELDAREAALKKREEEFAATAAAFADADAARRAAESTRRSEEDKSVLDGLVSAGRLPKVARVLAEALFAEVREFDNKVEFADGERIASASPRELLTRLLGSMPVPVPTGELAFGDVGVDGQDPQAIAAAITAAAAKHDGSVVKGLAAIRGAVK